MGQVNSFMDLVLTGGGVDPVFPPPPRRFFFQEDASALDVELIGDGFTAVHQVHISYGFQTPGSDGVQENTFRTSDVTTDDSGHFEQQESMPSNAFYIQGRATDTFTNTSTDSPVLRPCV